jgi:hypothetical protein
VNELHEAIRDRIARSDAYTRSVMLSRAILALEDPLGELEAEFPVSYDGALDLIARYGVRVRRGRLVRNVRPTRENLANQLGIPDDHTSGIIACPAHKDERPSLSWRRTADHRLLVHCFAGCTFDEIRQAAA